MTSQLSHEKLILEAAFEDSENSHSLRSAALAVVFRTIPDVQIVGALQGMGTDIATVSSSTTPRQRMNEHDRSIVNGDFKSQSLGLARLGYEKVPSNSAPRQFYAGFGRFYASKPRIWR